MNIVTIGPVLQETNEAVLAEAEAERLRQLRSANPASANQDQSQPVDVEMVDAPKPTDVSNEELGTAPVPHINGVVNGDKESSDVQQIPVASVATPDVPVVATNVPLKPLPKVYDIDFDKMQQKLYDKGYLTPDEFLQDLSRMVHNTRLPVYNLEHAFKAHQMYSEAEAVVWDTQFKLECERMAVREKAKRAAAKAEAMKSAPPQEVQCDQDAANQPLLSTLHSARANGEQPETEPNEDPTRLERTLKRQRMEGETTDGMRDSPFDAGNRSPVKRAKLSLEDETEMSGPSTLIPTSLGPCAENASAKPSVHFLIDPQSSFDTPVDTRSPIREQSVPTTDLNAGSPFPRIESTVTHAGYFPSHPSTSLHPPLPPQLNSVPGVLPVSSIPTRSPTPAPQYPPFEVSASGLQQLNSALVRETTDLTVEQLEHLRAMCLNCIWRRRGEWNRDQVIQEMLNIIHNLIREVSADDTSSP